MRPNIPALTSLRFFAALLVVIFHYNLSHPFFPNWIAGQGYAAVTFFFVLSGFILTYVHYEAGSGLNLSYRRFMWSRLLRIGPTYFLAITLIFALYFIAGILRDIDPLRAGLVLLMLQSWLPSSALYLNPPAWSLSNEIFFYLLFPPIIRILTRSEKTVLAFLATIAVLVCIVTLLRMKMLGDLKSPVSYFVAYFPLLNLPQFLLGIVLGYFFIVKPADRKACALAFSFGVAAFLILIFIRPPQILSANTALFCVVFVSIIYGAAGDRGVAHTILSHRALLFLGDASYAIYILHFPIWLWWNHFTSVAYQANLPLIVDFSIYIAAVVIGSAITLVFVERPVRRTLKTHHHSGH